MSNYKKSCIYGSICGIVLFFLEACSATLPYIKSSFLDVWLGHILIAFVLLGSILAIFTLLYKNRSLKHMICRFVALAIAFTSIFILFGEFEIILFIYEQFDIHCTDASDNVSGIGTVFFLISIVGSCLVTMLVACIAQIGRKAIDLSKK